MDAALSELVSPAPQTISSQFDDFLSLDKTAPTNGVGESSSRKLIEARKAQQTRLNMVNSISAPSKVKSKKKDSLLAQAAESTVEPAQYWKSGNRKIGNNNNRVKSAKKTKGESYSSRLLSKNASRNMKKDRKLTLKHADY